MSADPTAEHIDAVARTLSTPDWGEWSSAYHPDHNKWTFDGSHRTDGEREMYRNAASAILTSTDPAVHAARAASLPAEVMLAALVDRGTLTEEWRVWFTGSDAPTAPVDEATSRRFAGDHRERRRVTPWEVAE